MVAFGAGPAAVLLLPRADAPVVVLAPPWAAPDSPVKAALSVPGALLWTAADGRRVILAPEGANAPAALYRAGAVLVVRADASALCAGTQAAPSATLSTAAYQGTSR